MDEIEFAQFLNTVLLEHDAAILEAPKFSERVAARRQTRQQIIDYVSTKCMSNRLEEES